MAGMGVGHGETYKTRSWAQIRLGETEAAWDPGGTLLEAVGVDGGGFGEGGVAQGL